MRLSLVLGSGGARGYAHIGVIEELKRRGHEIVTISGCSIGALVGGLEAAGGLEEFTAWARELTQMHVLRMLDLTLGSAGFVKADRVIEEVNGFCGGARIEDLPIPFTAVASDITAGREVWFQEGLLANAIRASIAMPGVITPVRMQGHVLVDGGVCNPVPMEPTLSVPSDATVAVSLAGGSPVVEPRWALANSDDVQTGSVVSRVARGFEELMQSETVRSLSARIAALQNRGGEHEEPGLPDAHKSLSPGSADLIDRGKADISTTELAQQSIATMQAMIERYRAAANPAQIRITVPAAAGGTLDFHRANELIELGRELATGAFDRAGI